MTTLRQHESLNRLKAASTVRLAHPYYAPENGDYAIPLCSWGRAIMLRLCSDYAAYKSTYKWNSHTNLHTLPSVLDFPMVVSVTDHDDESEALSISQ